MATLYRIDLGHVPSFCAWMIEGESITVQGTPMVKLRHGAIVLAERFSPSLAEARLAAAAELEAVAAGLNEQAAEMRRQAATEQGVAA